LFFLALFSDPLTVQLSTNEYTIQESSGEVCLEIEANNASNESFSVFVMPIVKEPKCAAGELLLQAYTFLQIQI